MTSVRIPVSEWQWVKDNQYEFTALLRIKIRELKEEIEAHEIELASPAGQFKTWIAERNKAGLVTSAEEMGAKRRELGLI